MGKISIITLFFSLLISNLCFAEDNIDFKEKENPQKNTINITDPDVSIYEVDKYGNTYAQEKLPTLLI